MKFRYLIWCAAAVLSLVACKEEDTTIVDEFPNWQTTNDAYFIKLVEDAKAKKAAGEPWELYTTFTKPDNSFSAQYYDYVVVEKLSDGVGEAMPQWNDSVEVHYVGRLLPSVHYPEGMEIDRTYSGKFDEAVATPVTFAVSSMIDGFATAVQHMRLGDHWKVYIPYQLGYGANEQNVIPAYSNVIFDLRLENFWHKKKGDRY